MPTPARAGARVTAATTTPDDGLAWAGAAPAVEADDEGDEDDDEDDEDDDEEGEDEEEESEYESKKKE